MVKSSEIYKALFGGTEPESRLRVFSEKKTSESGRIFVFVLLANN
jgi:hypothetical protein